jgi:hypothetical protein
MLPRLYLERSQSEWQRRSHELTLEDDQCEGTVFPLSFRRRKRVCNIREMLPDGDVDELSPLRPEA